MMNAHDQVPIDYSGLLQDDGHDLVPDHPKDGEDVENYFRRTSEVMADP